MFKDRLKQERKALGWTQQKLADNLHTKRSNVSNWENGYNEAGSDLLQKCADLFNCSVDYLLGRTDERLPYSEWDKKFPIDKEEIKNLETISKNLTDDQKDELGFNSANQIGYSFFIEGLYQMGLLKHGEQLNENQIKTILSFIENNKEMIKFILERDEK